MSDKIEKLRNIKMLVMDVDGIMTDARIMLDANGEWKRFFSVRDGVGIHRLKDMGIRTAVITGSNSQDVRLRMQHLKIDYFFENKRDKSPAWEELKKQSNLSSKEMSYIGDDTFDIPLLQKAAFAVTVPEAVEEVKKECDHITKVGGGYGAVRELCELILQHSDNTR